MNYLRSTEEAFILPMRASEILSPVVSAFALNVPPPPPPPQLPLLYVAFKPRGAGQPKCYLPGYPHYVRKNGDVYGPGRGYRESLQTAEVARRKSYRFVNLGNASAEAL